MSRVLHHIAMDFRPMQLADLDAIMQIETVIYPYPWSRGNFSDSLNSGYSCWVCQVHGRIMGYAVLMMVLDEAHILNISIAQDFQRQGLGWQLLQFICDVARRQGGINMFLEVRVSNQAAIGLYEAAGFNEMAIRRNYYPAKNGREDAMLMGMAL